MSRVGLLKRKVLKDMKCDIEQLDRIMDILEEAEQKAQKRSRDAITQAMAGVEPGVPNAERRQKMPQVMKEAQELGEKEFKKATQDVIANNLTAPQRKRLREIDLQVRGYKVFQNLEAAKASAQRQAKGGIRREREASYGRAVQGDAAGRCRWRTWRRRRRCRRCGWRGRSPWS